MHHTAIGRERGMNRGWDAAKLMVISSLFAAGGYADTGGKIRIMPVGDSITRGSYAS